MKEIGYNDLKNMWNNSFIKILNMGDVSRIRLTDDLNEKVILNGFTIYYRVLFSAAILSKGKAVEFKKLENLEYLNMQKISYFV